MGTSGSWRSPPKDMAPSTPGTCPLCKKKVQSLEDHMRRVHKGAKV